MTQFFLKKKGIYIMKYTLCIKIFSFLRRYVWNFSGWVICLTCQNNRFHFTMQAIECLFRYEIGETIFLKTRQNAFYQIRGMRYFNNILYLITPNNILLAYFVQNKSIRKITIMIAIDTVFDLVLCLKDKRIVWARVKCFCALTICFDRFQG